MSDDYWKAHNQGRLGNAPPVGGGARAWQGYNQGQAERARQQQSAAPGQSTYSYSASHPSAPSPATGSGSGGSGDALPGFVLLIFMGLVTWGGVAINDSFKLTESNWLIPVLLVVSYLFGILILRALMIIFITICGLAILAGLGYWGWNYASDRIKTYQSQKPTAVLEEEGRPEVPGCAICQGVVLTGAEVNQTRMSFSS